MKTVLLAALESALADERTQSANRADAAKNQIDGLRNEIAALRLERAPRPARKATVAHRAAR